MRLRTGLQWIVTFAAFLVTAEIFGRIDDNVTWGAPLVGPYSEEMLTMRDSFGVRGRPNYRFQKWRMNNVGFRGRDLSVVPHEGRTRIVVLGASESFGLAEAEGLEYPAQLASVLDSMAAGRFEVVNAALAGMSLSAMVPFFREVVAPIRPALVLVYPSPTFYLSVTSVPDEYSILETTSGERARTSWWQTLGPPRVVAKGRNVLKELIPTPMVTWYRAQSLRRIRAGHDPKWVWESVPEDRMQLMTRHLDRLVRTIQSSGARVVLVTHTNRFVGAGAAVTSQNRHHLINLMALYHPQASERTLVAVDSLANTIVRRVAAERSVPVLEAEGQVPTTSEYFADYAHFTNAGARAMARLLAAGLLALDHNDGGPLD